MSAVLGGAASVLGGGKFANGAVTGAFSYAAGASYGDDDAPQFSTTGVTGTANGANSLAQFGIDKETFFVYDAPSMGTVSDIENDLTSIFSTPRGADMLSALEGRSNNNFAIDLSGASSNSIRAGISNMIQICLACSYQVQTTDGWITANLTRQIAHELGHAVFGAPAEGVRAPFNMQNINQNENPIMNSLGQPSRTAYPGPR